MGVVTAHYGVEAAASTGFAWLAVPTASPVPGTFRRVVLDCDFLARSGAVYGAAHQWRGTKGQKLGVNVLFLALFAVVGGSLTGEWFEHPA